MDTASNFAQIISSMAAMSVVDDMVESEASVVAREVGASLSVALVPLQKRINSDC